MSTQRAIAYRELRWLYTGLIALARCETASALPPLGLTQISPTPASSSNLEIIGESAYVSVPGGVWNVNSSGNTSFISVSHPTLGLPYHVTRIVDGPGGKIYVGANFRNSIFSQPALFSLDQPTLPVVTWGYGSVNGVDASLRTFGNMQTDGGYEATWFYLDGSTEALDYPPGSDSTNNLTSLTASTPSGYAIGDAGIPMTIGSAPVLWTPEGDFSFLDGAGFSTSIRDRTDGQGVNAGWNVILPMVKYGHASAIEVKDQFGGFIDTDERIIVSQSEFVVFNTTLFLQPANYFAFYPGLIPNHPDRALPLLDIFPELASIDIDEITDLAAVHGYIYMTITGSDGQYLFGARDPSVIPEPATLLLAALAAVVLAMAFGGRR